MFSYSLIGSFPLSFRREMNSFQRSYSRVWFAPQQSVYDNFYSLPTYESTARGSLRSITEQDESLTSPKEAVQQQQQQRKSFNVWERKSPSSHSHKSQVSVVVVAVTSS